jgi:uncharacterized protein (TIGR01777 family)
MEASKAYAAITRIIDLGEDEMRMKIAISGGSGFIGTHLIQHLVKQQHEVLLISRSIKSAPKGVNCLTWAELDHHIQPLEQLDAWINLAGETINQRWTAAAKERIQHSRVSTIQHMAKLLEKLQNKPKVIINSSAIGIYGTSELETFTEYSVTRPKDFLSTIVDQWEKATDQLKGTRVVKVRTGLVLGMNGGALPSMVMPYRLGVGGKVGTGRQWVSWIHIEDLVRVFEFCITNEQIVGAVNAASPNPIRMDSFGKIIGRVWRRPHLFPVPSFVLKLLFGEMSMLILEGQRVIPELLLAQGFPFDYVQLEEALKQLNSSYKG